MTFKAERLSAIGPVDGAFKTVAVVIPWLSLYGDDIDLLMQDGWKKSLIGGFGNMAKASNAIKNIIKNGLHSGTISVVYLSQSIIPDKYVVREAMPGGLGPWESFSLSGAYDIVRSMLMGGDNAQLSRSYVYDIESGHLMTEIIL